MSKALLVAAIFCGLLAMPSQAQSYHVRVYGGLETHGHGDLKQLQQEQQQLVNLGSDLRIVESYPTRVGVSGELVVAFNASVKAGVVAGYGATGGRLHYADYSGEVQFDQVLHRWYGGVTLETKLGPRGPLWLMMQLRYSRSELAVSSLIRLGDEAFTEEDQLTAAGLSLAPGVVFELKPGPVELRMVAGFEYSLIAPYLPGTLSNVLYLDGEETNLQAEWSGFRLGISVGWIVNRRGR